MDFAGIHSSTFFFLKISLKKWNDYNLKWNPKVYGNITSVVIPSTKIWIPDLALYDKSVEKNIFFIEKRKSLFIFVKC